MVYHLVMEEEYLFPLEMFNYNCNIQNVYLIEKLIIDRTIFYFIKFVYLLKLELFGKMNDRQMLLTLVAKIYEESRYPTDEEIVEMKLSSIKRDSCNGSVACFNLQHEARKKGENPLLWILICWYAAREDAIHLHYGCRIYHNILTEMYYDDVLEYIVMYIQDQKFKDYILKTLNQKFKGFKVNDVLNNVKSLESALTLIKKWISDNRPNFYLE